MEPKFNEVSFGCSRGTALWPSRLIEWLDGEYSHCYYKFTATNGLKFLYESHISGGVQITPYEHLEDAIIDGRVEKIKEIKLPDVNPDSLWKQCLPLHGAPYDKNQIVRYFIWLKYFHGKDKCILHLQNDGQYTCNEFCITSGRNVVPILKDIDYSYTPNRLLKVFNEHYAS